MSRSVFVGNIPYEATEQQLKDVFSTAGKVVNFRLVFDRDTGKPKGFGFCEFIDAGTAQSAIRNLSGQDFNGRPLRVSYADDDKEKEGGRGAFRDRTPKPPVKDSVETISDIVIAMSQTQQLELLTEMKNFAEANPEGAKKLLVRNPQFARAILQIQSIFKLVHPDVLQEPLRPPPNPHGRPGPRPGGRRRGPPGPRGPPDYDRPPLRRHSREDRRRGPPPPRDHDYDRDEPPPPRMARPPYRRDDYRRGPGRMRGDRDREREDFHDGPPPRELPYRNRADGPPMRRGDGPMSRGPRDLSPGPRRGPPPPPRRGAPPARPPPVSSAIEPAAIEDLNLREDQKRVLGDILRLSPEEIANLSEEDQRQVHHIRKMSLQNLIQR